MKKHSSKLQIWLKDKDVIYFAICLLILVIILVLRFAFHSHLSEIIDIDMLTSVVVAFFLTTLATIIARAFSKAFEDVTKLTTDYNTLVKMYKSNTEMLFCQNDRKANKKIGRKTTCTRLPDESFGDAYEIPVGDVILLHGRKLVIHDNPEEQFVPPEFCQTHYAELLNAHDFSKTYNQLTLRVDDIEEIGGEVHISFSRSTYFDALVSNRAIDYKIGGLCVRDIYAHGPFLTPLKSSKLSNHLGFNGMVETSDGMFVFVKRHGKVSIGKNTMQCSIASSMKAKYTLDKSGRITKQGIENAIKNEIEDELDLKKLKNYVEKKKEIFNDFSFENNVLYFYRDLLEGGKPQFMFYAKLNIHSSELKHALTQKKKVSLERDGNKTIFVDRQELKRMYLAPDEMVINDRYYPAMPSAVATVAMLRQAMNMGLLREDIQESFTISKKGDSISNEDAIYVDDRFIAVIDGVTAKCSPPANATMSSGRFAARAVCRAIARIGDLTKPEDIIRYLNEKLKDDIASSVFGCSEEKPLASVVIYDSLTQKVISYGDCGVLLQDKVYKREKEIDKQLAEKRSNILQTYLKNGHTYEEISQNDVGRAAIVEELSSRSAKYANRLTGDGFPVLGIGEVVADFIDVYTVKIGESVVLASDGYPVLAETLSKSETALFNIIEKDPMLIYKYKATKGIAKDNISFDDRTYIRFTVQ